MLYSLSRTPSASTHRDRERHTHSTCKAKKVFALLEVREMFAGYFCVWDFLLEVRRVFVTELAWEAAGGEVLDARRK